MAVIKHGHDSRPTCDHGYVFGALMSSKNYNRNVDFNQKILARHAFDAFTVLLLSIAVMGTMSYNDNHF